MRVRPATLAALLAVAVAGCGSAQQADESAAAGASSMPSVSASPVPQPPESSAPQTATTPDPAPATAGSWIDLAAYEADPATFHAAGDVVLFFNASWCPTCQRAVGNLDAEGAPPGLTVVSVDYDSSDSLRRQYGVTVQHTFVHVDEGGQQLAKFTGSLTGAEIAAGTA
jgi:thiol-disulfide isomerase/thioredoxin